MKAFCAFSGGADSTALALLHPEATPVFTDTGWEFDELYEHIDKFERVTGREVHRIQPEMTLPEYIRKYKFFPNHGARFCTRVMKIEPMDEFLKSQTPCELWIGLRADEDRTGNAGEVDGCTYRYPLAEAGMDRMDVIKVCLEQDLLPRYPVYMARGGCKGCFYKRAPEVKAMIHLVPEVIAELDELEQSVQDEREGFFHCFANVKKPIAQLVKEETSTLFDKAEAWAAAAETDDVGEACGMFCHR